MIMYVYFTDSVHKMETLCARSPYCCILAPKLTSYIRYHPQDVIYLHSCHRVQVYEKCSSQIFKLKEHPVLALGRLPATGIKFTKISSLNDLINDNTGRKPKLTFSLLKATLLHFYDPVFRGFLFFF